MGMLDLRGAGFGWHGFETAEGRPQESAPMFSAGCKGRPPLTRPRHNESLHYAYLANNRNGRFSEVVF